MTAGKLQRWALFLTEFDYEIIHIKGSTNSVADVLSRLPLAGKGEEDNEEYLKFIERSCPIDACCIRVEIKKDSILSKILNFVTEGFPTEVMYKDMIPYFIK